MSSRPASLKLLSPAMYARNDHGFLASGMSSPFPLRRSRELLRSRRLRQGKTEFQTLVELPVPSVSTPQHHPNERVEDSVSTEFCAPSGPLPRRNSANTEFLARDSVRAESWTPRRPIRSAELTLPARL